MACADCGDILNGMCFLIVKTYLTILDCTASNVKKVGQIWPFQLFSIIAYGVAKFKCFSFFFIENCKFTCAFDIGRNFDQEVIKFT